MSTSRLLTALFACLPLAATAAAAPKPAAKPTPVAGWDALPAKPLSPADNPSTPAKVTLGQMLFFDPRLSSTGTVSCFSCHNVMEGGDDHRPTSLGVGAQAGGRNSPTVWNAAYSSTQFWDGRAATLEAQALGPPVNSIEMGMGHLEAVLDRIKHIPGYQAYFTQAFGPKDSLTMDNAARAIAAYERTLVTPNTPYDRFVRGDAKAISAQAQRGMATFREVGCVACHQGANFNGPALPTGTGFFMKFPTFPESPYVAKYDLMGDTGRETVTHDAADAHLWRVPTLRNLEYTAPYMHNGHVKSLPEAVRVMASTQLNVTLTDPQVDDLVAFLLTLGGGFPRETMPRLPATPGDLIDDAVAVRAGGAH